MLPQWYSVAREGAVWYRSSFRLAVCEGGKGRGIEREEGESHNRRASASEVKITTPTFPPPLYAPSMPSITARPPAWMQKWSTARLKSGT